jgi:hypothetical protein
MNNKVKIYRNPERKQPTNVKHYVPQYRQLGIDPEEHVDLISPGNQERAVKKKMPSVSSDNSFPSNPVVHQAYAKPVPSPVGAGRGSLPNIGNNMEQTWATMDGKVVDIIDNISELDLNQPMIDNNDYVSDQALGLPSDGIDENDESLLENELDLKRDEYLSLVIQKLPEDEYLLIVSGECICYGLLEAVQEQARAMAFGEHELCGDSPIPIDDIIVIKRVPIKVGLFLS